MSSATVTNRKTKSQGWDIGPYQSRLKTLIPNLERDLEWGWLIPFMVLIDEKLDRRWEYWGRTMMAGRLLDEPIPRIEFDPDQGSNARKNLEDSLNCIPRHGSWEGWSSWTYVDYFLDWLLFAFGHSGHKVEPKEPAGCEGASMRLYQVFDLGLQMKYPNDNLGDILAENRFGQKAGFYPTPGHIVDCMTRMLFGFSGDDLPDQRTKKVCDPCLGTGRMLLYSSNYSLRLYGNDINLTVVKTALVNGYFYAPWMVKPFPFLDLELTRGSDLLPCGKTISEMVSDLLAETASTRPDVTDYLADTEFDSENQPLVEPIKLRKKKGQQKNSEDFMEVDAEELSEEQLTALQPV